AMAEHTSHARLGIVRGISVLGTTGIVRPFSTASWRASVVQQVDVAAAQGERTIVLATGSRSDVAAQRLLPRLPTVCFVEVGDFTGIALRRAAAAGMRRAVFVGMAGKIAKLAAGVMMTHFHRSRVDGDVLARAALEAGAPLVAGGHRQLGAAGPVVSRRARTAPVEGDVAAVLDAVAAEPGRVCVLASGDPGFFGIVRPLARRFGPGLLEVHPAPSSVSLAFARLGLSWDDAAVVS